jgi:hypothetical protein
MVTRPASSGILDLVFGGQAVQQKTHTEEYAHVGSDRLQLNWCTQLTNQSRPAAPQVVRINYKKLDWEKFEEQVTILSSQYRLRDIRADRELDYLAKDVSNLLDEALQAAAPLLRISPFAKRWWTKELTRKCKELQASFKRWQITLSERDKDKYFPNAKRVSQRNR